MTDTWAVGCPGIVPSVLQDVAVSGELRHTFSFGQYLLSGPFTSVLTDGPELFIERKHGLHGASSTLAGDSERD